MQMVTIKECKEAKGEITTLWGIGFDSESKELTVDPIRDRRLTFRNPDELEWFISGLRDCAQLWSKDDMSQDADFYVDMPEAIDDMSIALPAAAL